MRDKIKLIVFFSSFVPKPVLERRQRTNPAGKFDSDAPEHRPVVELLPVGPAVELRPRVSGYVQRVAYDEGSDGWQLGANLLALRSHNTALVLDLLRTAGADGISRLELAERTPAVYPELKTDLEES